MSSAPDDRAADEPANAKPSEHAGHGPRAVIFVPALLIGCAVILFGAHAALHDARDAHPFALAVHIVTFDLGHDALLAPLAFLVFALAGRVLPLPLRGPARAALAMTALFVAFSYPLVKRWGRRPTNSSTLPLPYGRNLAIVLGIVWIGAAIVAAVRVVKSNSNSNSNSKSEAGATQ